MLQTLLKVLLFFAVVLAAALGATRLAETGQSLRLVFNGVEYTLGPVQVAVLAVVVIVASWLLMKILGFLWALLRFITGDETAVTRWFDRSRQRKGWNALAEGMLSVASGEGRLAQDQARKAAKYLDAPHVTDLLAAQAAEVAGDTRAAEATYRRLLGDSRTRFVGVRGLMRQRMAAGDTGTALKLAEKAYALKPRHNEIQDTLLQLQAQAHDWKGARGVLKDKRHHGQLPKDVHLRRDAVLALQEAREVLEHGASISAREAAISANRASPDLIPAAVLAARSYIEQKDPRNASRVLQKTWSVRPHPSLAAVYAEIVPDETPAQRVRRFEDLLRQRPDDPESRLLRAELLLAAEDFPGARRALGDLAQTDPTVRSLAIMAAIERGEGADDSVVRGWLTRAMTASRGPQWVCDKCHNVMADWSPICDSCGAFDTLTWRRADTGAAATVSPTGAEMLPLIVGGPASPAEKPASPPAVVEPAPPPPAMEEPAAMSEKPAPERPAPVVTAMEIAAVPPGMVPRESDFVAWEPSATTVTTPEPAVIVAPDGTAHIETPAPKAGTETEVEVVPVRPDVEPVEEAAQQRR